MATAQKIVLLSLIKWKGNGWGGTTSMIVDALPSVQHKIESESVQIKNPE